VITWAGYKGSSAVGLHLDPRCATLFDRDALEEFAGVSVDHHQVLAGMGSEGPSCALAPGFASGMVSTVGVSRLASKEINVGGMAWAEVSVSRPFAVSVTLQAVMRFKVMSEDWLGQDVTVADLD
jgi:hypothetical protein